MPLMANRKLDSKNLDSRVKKLSSKENLLE
jgi:hypothetical protein